MSDDQKLLFRFEPLTPGEEITAPPIPIDPATIQTKTFTEDPRLTALRDKDGFLNVVPKQMYDEAIAALEPFVINRKQITAKHEVFNGVVERCLDEAAAVYKKAGAK